MGGWATFGLRTCARCRARSTGGCSVRFAMCSGNAGSVFARSYISVTTLNGASSQSWVGLSPTIVTCKCVKPRNCMYRTVHTVVWEDGASNNGAPPTDCSRGNEMAPSACRHRGAGRTHRGIESHLTPLRISILGFCHPWAPSMHRKHTLEHALGAISFPQGQSDGRSAQPLTT